MNIVETALSVAQREIGTKEEPLGSNRGPRVEQYQAAAFGEPGNYWCMQFVVWVLCEAAKAEVVPVPILRSGSCDLVLAWARARGIVYTTPRKGDIFLVMASETDAIHTGLVAALHPAGSLTTIEGNSNNNGSRNGTHVVERPRGARGLLFVRWAELVDAPTDLALYLNLKKLGALVMADGVGYVPVRTLTNALGIDQSAVLWDGEAQSVRINGRLIPASILLREGAAHAPVRVVAKMLGLDCDFDKSAKRVTLTRAFGSATAKAA